MTFKPKKQQIHVPGFGVVQKEDFSNVHYEALMKRAGSKRDAFIKQHLVVESYGDQPLFEETEQEAPKENKELPKEKPVSKKGKKAKLTEDEELEKLIAEEEANKTGN